MSRRLYYPIVVLLLFALSGCRRGHQSFVAAFNKEIYVPQYASGFRIMGQEGKESTLIQVFNPWQGAKDVVQSYFVQRNGEAPPPSFDGQVIKGGAGRIVCMSSSHISMLDALGESERIVGVSGMAYISNPRIQARRDSIGDVGAEMNYELLLRLKPDIVLMYGIDDEQASVTGKLEEFSIPYMYIGEYVEESPLGKAEWVMTLAEIADCRAKGKETFGQIPVRYFALKEQAAAAAQRPSVMLNTPWNDQWMMPSTQSYMARLITDAGGEYIYKGNDSKRSVPIGLETAYQLIQQADYWLNVGSASSLSQLQVLNPRFATARAVKNHRVYNNNRRTTPAGGSDFWESAAMHPDVVLRDLIYILHPELAGDSLYYYKQLE